MAFAHIVLFVVVAGCAAWLQVSRLVAVKEYKQVVMYFLLMGTAVVIGSMEIAGIRLPSPHMPIEALLKPFGRWIFHGNEG